MKAATNRQNRLPCCLIFFCVLVGGVFTAPKSMAQGIFAGGYIQYQATQLADNNPGEQMWEYSYSLNGFTFNQNQGFSVYFDPQNYRVLQNPLPSTGGIWSTLVVQPDLGLNDRGFFDALALVNSPSTAQLFKVDFIWLGTGTPSSQPFNTYDVGFSPAFVGTTVIPEPRCWQLLGLGALILFGHQIFRERKTIRSR